MQDGRRLAWQPPERPDWVARLNAEGKGLDLHSLVPLDADSLIGAARQATGLSDFGADEWRAPFYTLVRSLAEEADLNLAGRLLTRNDIILYLSARLQVEETYRRHPEIDEEVIEAPLLIIGQGRSGTSFLLNLLNEDPANRAVREWEAMYPAPPALGDEQEIARRIARADHIWGMSDRVTPEVTAVHEFNGRVPTESIHLCALAFVGDWIPGLLGQVPSFQAFAAPLIEHGLRYEKRVLKLLQWRQPKRRWVLKNPAGLPYLATELKVYPDMRIVWAHRDPTKALASVVALQGVLNWVRSDAPFREGAHEHFLDSAIMGQALAGPIDLIESGVIARERIAGVQYRDLIGDPVAAVARLYADLGMVLDEAGRSALQSYMDRQPRSTRPPHRYDKGDPATLARDRANFSRYQKYFDVPNED